MVRNYDDEMDDFEAEPSPSSLAHWLEEQYTGDERFGAVEVEEPGPVEGEAARVKFICNEASHFFVSIIEEDAMVRIGLATASADISEGIESAANDSGNSLTEFLEENMNAEDELEHEVQHFHDDAYYFCSDLPYQRDEDLVSSHFRDEVIYYLDGYMTALYDYVEEDEE